MLFVRWSKLLECSQRNTIVIGDDVSDSIPSSNPQAGGANPCHELLDYSLVDSLGGASCAEGAVLTYFFSFCLYWLVTLKLFVNAVRDGLEMRVFYNQKLDIRDVSSRLSSCRYCATPIFSFDFLPLRGTPGGPGFVGVVHDYRKDCPTAGPSQALRCQGPDSARSKRPL